jgi:hypothetical protein
MMINVLTYMHPQLHFSDFYLSPWPSRRFAELDAIV